MRIYKIFALVLLLLLLAGTAMAWTVMERRQRWYGPANATAVPDNTLTYSGQAITFGGDYLIAPGG